MLKMLLKNLYFSDYILFQNCYFQLKITSNMSSCDLNYPVEVSIATENSKRVVYLTINEFY